MVWSDFIQKEKEQSYFVNLQTFVREQIDKGEIIRPPLENVFRAFDLTPLNQVKVVIFGQDPYQRKDLATGLAFSVNENVDIPPSLENIFKEIKREYGESPKNRTLEGWARQGVLLLNSQLTVSQTKPLSHRGHGWELFVDHVIMELNHLDTPLVYLLWGAEAKAHEELIVPRPNLATFTSAHPSPFSFTKGFWCNNHFRKTNDFLEKWNVKPIDWINS
jgi:uracil-DNA glycosylase